MDPLSSKTNRIDAFEPQLDRVPVAVVRALQAMGQRLERCGAVWLVGGSCGALLQGVALEAVPRDLDVYVDADRAADVHAALSAYATDEQAYSETAMYRSLLSHYFMEGVQVELVGSLNVRLDEAEYEVRVQSLLSGYAAIGLVGQTPIRFMPLSHELLFNVLRDRTDRYRPIAAAIRGNPQLHVPLLAKLIGDNRIGSRYAEKIRALLDLPPDWGRNG